MNQSSITGLVAFQTILRLIKPVNGSTKLWLKLGHNRFVVGDYTEDGHYSIWETRLTDPDNTKSRIFTKQHPDAWEFISNWAKQNDGGVFYIPTQPQGLPIKEDIAVSDDIAAELDEGTAQEQWEKIKEFVKISGLKPAFVFFSGSKSYHAHFKGTEHLPITQRTYLTQLLCIGLNSDYAIANPHQPMRIAGFYRREKGREQTLEYYSEARYTYEEFIAGFRAYFEVKGIPFPEEISEERWRIYKRMRNKGNLDLSILVKPESELYPKPNYSATPTVSLSYNGQIPLHLALSKAHQEDLGGVSSDRNIVGYALARDLIGCYNWLITNGYSVEGDPYDLFMGYCQSCTPGGGWNYREWESVWRSANSNNPTPSRQDLTDFIHWYRLENDPDYREASIAEFIKRNLPLISEPDPIAYKEYCAREEEQELIEKAVDNNSTSSYQLHKYIKEAQARDKKQFLAENALLAESRDKAVRLLSKSIGLDEPGHQYLKVRGLSAEAIKEGLFFNIDPRIRFNLTLPYNLPGIHYKGDRFATNDTGIACPIFDNEGRAIGWQLLVLKGHEKNKYKWAKSSFSSHLANSELPISIAKPVKINKSPLYLCEQVLKSYIASHKHNIAVCSASNGYFSASPEQFALIQQNHSEFAIIPDAGDLENPEVIRRWEQQINFLKQFNKPIKVLWWGQSSKKKHCSIDEIDSLTFNKADYLTPEYFFNLAKTQQYIKQQQERYTLYKKFTAQIKINKKYVDFDAPLQNSILFIKSALGSGKTTQLIKVLKKFAEKGILNIGYRNTLLLQYNEKAKILGFYHLQSDKALKEFSLFNPTIRVSNCIDSLIYYIKENFDSKIIILDEIVSTLKHFLTSATIKNFEKIKELFTEMIQRADRIICLDGFMQDWVVKFFKEIAPSKKIVTLENIHKGDKPKTYLLEGTIDVKEKIRANDKTPWLEKLLESGIPAICSDSQIFCEAIENLLMVQGRMGLRIDSKTVSEKEVKEFLANPDKYIKNNLIEYLIYSPSMESGADVAITNHFTELFAFFFGTLDIDSCCQILARVRDINVPRYIWAKKFIVSEDIIRRPSNMEQIQASRERLMHRELDITIRDAKNLSKEELEARVKQIYQMSCDAYSNVADIIQAIRNFELANYRECLKNQLIECGYPVEVVTLESPKNRKELSKKEKEAKAEVKLQSATDIYNASDRYIGQPQVNLNFDASYEKRCEVAKASLVNLLPEINKSDIWSPDFIKFVKYDKPQAVKQAQFSYLLENPDIAKLLAERKYNKIFNLGSIAAPWKLRQDYLIIQTLIDIGLRDFLEKISKLPSFTFNEETPEVKEILKKSQRKKSREILGYIGKYQINYFKKLLKTAGVEIQSRQIRDKDSGTRKRIYSIDYRSIGCPQFKAVKSAIKLKYEQIVNAIEMPLNWVIPEQEKSHSNKEVVEQGQTIDISSLDPVTDDPNIYINKTGICDKVNIPISVDNQQGELDNTIKIQDRLDSEESIKDIAWMLNSIVDVSGLEEIMSLDCCTRDRLNKAWLRLDKNKQKQIAAWVKQIKTEQLDKSNNKPLLEWDYVIGQINDQIKRIGKGVEYWKKYLLGKYKVASRLFLSDKQLLEFWQYLVEHEANEISSVVQDGQTIDVSSLDPVTDDPLISIKQPGMCDKPDNQPLLEWDYIIGEINQHIERIGLTVEYWKQYLLEKYNVASRLFLSDWQLIEFWEYLINFST